MTGRPSVGVPTREVNVRWQGDGLLFEARAGDRPPVLVDGSSQQSLSPVELLLASAAACAGADVVLILGKQRAELRSLTIAMTGTRRDTEPRRFLAVHFHFTAAGVGVDLAKLRRAVTLSLDKYCSVVATLAPDTTVTCDCTVV